MGCPKITYDYQEEGLEKSTVHFFGQLAQKRGQQKNRINYYPFGLTFNSYKREDNKKNNYKYNGKEEHEETGWYDFGARMYQADLGRWFNMDPLAEKYYDMTPYKYGLNNPIAYTDPTGMTEVYGVEMDLGATGSVTSVVDATPDVVENGVRYESMDDFIEQAGKDYVADLQKRMSSAVQEGKAQEMLAKILQDPEIAYLYSLAPNTEFDIRMNQPSYINPKTEPLDGDKTKVQPARIILGPNAFENSDLLSVIVGHELIHAHHYESGKYANWINKYGFNENMKYYAHYISEAFAYQWSVPQANKLGVEELSSGATQYNYVVNNLPKGFSLKK